MFLLIFCLYTCTFVFIVDLIVVIFFVCFLFLFLRDIVFLLFFSHYLSHFTRSYLNIPADWYKHPFLPAGWFLFFYSVTFPDCWFCLVCV